MENKRSTVSMMLVLMLIVPLLSGLLLGIEMKNNAISHVPTVIVDNDMTDFSNTLTAYVDDVAAFNVLKKNASESEMQEMIKNGKAVIGVVFPENMYRDMRKGGSPKVLLFYDASQLHMMAFSKSVLTELILTAQAGFMQNIYEGKLNIPQAEASSFILPIDVNYQTLFNPAKSLKDYLITGLLASLMQIGIALAGVEASKWHISGMKQRIKLISTFSIFGTLSAIIVIGVQIWLFCLPWKGTLSGGIVMSFLFVTCIFSFGYIVGTVIKDRALAVQIAGVIVIPTSILGGFTFPVMAMPPVMQAFARTLPFTYYSNIMRRLSLMDLGWKYLIPDLMFFISYIAIEMLIILFVTGRRSKYEQCEE